jgi:hypothetical protein
LAAANLSRVSLISAISAKTNSQERSFVFSCDWANKIRELDDAASYSSALAVSYVLFINLDSSDEHLFFLLQSLSRLFQVLRDSEFPLPFTPGEFSRGCASADEN